MLRLPIGRRGGRVRKTGRSARRGPDRGDLPQGRRATGRRGVARFPRRQAGEVQDPRADHRLLRTAAAPRHRENRPARAQGPIRALRLDRRTLLIGGGAGVGLIVAFAAWPRHWGSELTPSRGEQTFGSYLKIAHDGRITVAVPQVETGQGIWTGLAQIVADELGAAWETIAVEPAPLAKAYANPLAKAEGWPAGIRITANSTSVRAFEQPLREAAATARMMLIGAAADRWQVDPAACDTADG